MSRLHLSANYVVVLSFVNHSPILFRLSACWPNCFILHSQMKFVILVISLFFACALPAQKPAYYIKSGDAAAVKGSWNEAFAYYNEAHLLDTSDFEISCKLADAARWVKQYDLALKLYSKNYDKDNGKLNPDGLFWLAVMQKNHARYEDAQRNFKKYIKKHKKTGTASLVKRAEQEIKSALWALNYKSKGEVDELQKLNEKINSNESEIAPFLDTDQFYFASSRRMDGRSEWNIFRMDSINAAQINVLQIDGLQSTDAGANLIVKGNEVFFSMKRDGATSIFTGTLSDNQIVNPKPVDGVNDGGSVNTMPNSGSTDGVERLYFVSDRKGGEGGLDIWYSIRQNGQWQTPVNAGKTINTPGDEVSPFVVGDQLFFSSDWHEGFGGLDIFSSKIFAGSFDKPNNLGKPYNSELNDLYYSESADGKQIFFSSNRRAEDQSDSATCCNDIFLVNRKRIDDVVINDKVYESLEALQGALPVVLYFHNDEPNPRSLDTTTVISYHESYESYLKLIPAYLKENSTGLSGEKREEAESITNDFFDLQVKKGYDDLKIFSDLLLEELHKGNSIKISVRGFASPRAKSDYNLNLTKRRTASLVNFLMQYNDGVFKSYFEAKAGNGARLIVEQLPFGEYKSAVGVSDDLNDQKKSIYSRAASLERKIEIESVIILKEAENKSSLNWTESEYDFGKIGKYEKVYHTFHFTNTSDREVRIDSAVASCGCTEPKVQKNILLPGESSTMEVGFDPFGKKGRDVKTVSVFIHGEEPKVIRIIAEVEH